MGALAARDAPNPLTPTLSPWGRGRRKPHRRSEGARDPKSEAAFRNRTRSLNAALARLPDYVGVVKRGTNLTAEQIALHVPGRIVTKEAFTSTSTGRPFGGTVRFVIHSLHGKKIAPYSAYPSEDEVLFAAGTRFKVKRVRVRGGVTYIEMDEVDG